MAATTPAAHPRHQEERQARHREQVAEPRWAAGDGRSRRRLLDRGDRLRGDRRARQPGKSPRARHPTHDDGGDLAAVVVDVDRLPGGATCAPGATARTRCPRGPPPALSPGGVDRADLGRTDRESSQTRPMVTATGSGSTIASSSVAATAVGPAAARSRSSDAQQPEHVVEEGLEELVTETAGEQLVQQAGEAGARSRRRRTRPW